MIRFSSATAMSALPVAPTRRAWPSGSWPPPRPWPCPRHPCSRRPGRSVPRRAGPRRGGHRSSPGGPGRAFQTARRARRPPGSRRTPTRTRTLAGLDRVVGRGLLQPLGLARGLVRVEQAAFRARPGWAAGLDLAVPGDPGDSGPGRDAPAGEGAGRARPSTSGAGGRRAGGIRPGGGLDFLIILGGGRLGGLVGQGDRPVVGSNRGPRRFRPLGIRHGFCPPSCGGDDGPLRPVPARPPGMRRPRFPAYPASHMHTRGRALPPRPAIPEGKTTMDAAPSWPRSPPRSPHRRPLSPRMRVTSPSSPATTCLPST